MNNKNTMGSEVKNGYICKPKQLDDNKPIMFSALQIYICAGERCNQVMSGNNLAERLRKIIKDLGYNTGKDRIKVTRTFCNGACRFKVFAHVYRNPILPNATPQNSYYAWKKVHELTDDQWTMLITSLLEGCYPESLEEYLVESKIYFEDIKPEHHKQ